MKADRNVKKFRNSAVDTFYGGFTASKIRRAVNFSGGFSADKYSAAAEGSR